LELIERLGTRPAGSPERSILVIAGEGTDRDGL
jgi:hypothetical protein